MNARRSFETSEELFERHGVTSENFVLSGLLLQRSRNYVPLQNKALKCDCQLDSVGGT
jgi:hypothetical protein